VILQSRLCHARCLAEPRQRAAFAIVLMTTLNAINGYKLHLYLHVYDMTHTLYIIIIIMIINNNNSNNIYIHMYVSIC
jgi:hypothetical protein